MRSDSQGLSLGEYPGGCVNTHHWAPCALFPSGRGQVPGDGEGISCVLRTSQGLASQGPAHLSLQRASSPALPILGAPLPHFAISSKHLVHAQGGKAIPAVPTPS